MINNFKVKSKLRSVISKHHSEDQVEAKIPSLQTLPATPGICHWGLFDNMKDMRRFTTN